MEISSSLKIHKTILAIFSIILLSIFPAEGIKRSSFPPEFLFGAGTSALQVEGSAHEGGRGPGVWDAIAQHNARKIKNLDKFPTMIEHYKRYKDDVRILKELGINSYRFSISWSRIIPDGTLEGGVNQEGIDFYNNLIDELLANGITPFVTILHFDFPNALQENLGGFLNCSIVNFYMDYSELLFKEYGDRVKHWTTINEPEVTALFNYMHGFENIHAEPCQKTKECREGYTVLHNFILCHVAAVQQYREKFQASQGGEIGIAISAEDYIPYSSKPEDKAAAKRLKDFHMGWVIEPLIKGDYPKIMREMVGERLPIFTEEEKKLVKGSTDFIGINYYRSFYVRHEPNKTLINGMDYFDSFAVKEVLNAERTPLGDTDKETQSSVYPEGLYNVLIYFKKKYKDPKIYITENGIGVGKIDDPLKDKHRIDYFTKHLIYTNAAIQAGVNVRGYFLWSAFDTFEFYDGYSERYGLIYVDFSDNLKRKAKDSAKWYRNFLNGNSKKMEI